MVETILILSPHTDDGEIGAGGTIAKFIEDGKEVYYVAFSSCEASVPEGFPKETLKLECKKAMNVLGISPKNVTFMNYGVRTFPSYRQKILDDLITIGRKIEPNLVLIPSSSDIHQDHQIIHAEALRAFKKTSSIWGYEHPWNNLTFTTDVFVNLEEKHIQKKINVLKQYKSQDFRTYFNEQYIKALAYTRGAQIDVSFAESFELLRMLVD
ncbi:MAG: PIG-L family deacetylase [Candidatus Methanoperedens sp.]|nr:PIG-L family deacetylase [Candidatus Methanoperedens sp.]